MNAFPCFVARGRDKKPNCRQFFSRAACAIFQQAMTSAAALLTSFAIEFVSATRHLSARIALPARADFAGFAVPLAERFGCGMPRHASARCGHEMGEHGGERFHSWHPSKSTS